MNGINKKMMVWALLIAGLSTPLRAASPHQPTPCTWGRSAEVIASLARSGLHVYHTHALPDDHLSSSPPPHLPSKLALDGATLCTDLVQLITDYRESVTDQQSFLTRPHTLAHLALTARSSHQLAQSILAWVQEPEDCDTLYTNNSHAQQEPENWTLLTKDDIAHLAQTTADIVAALPNTSPYARRVLHDCSMIARTGYDISTHAHEGALPLALMALLCVEAATMCHDVLTQTPEDAWWAEQERIKAEQERVRKAEQERKVREEQERKRRAEQEAEKERLRREREEQERKEREAREREEREKKEREEQETREAEERKREEELAREAEEREHKEREEREAEERKRKEEEERAAKQEREAEEREKKEREERERKAREEELARETEEREHKEREEREAEERKRKEEERAAEQEREREEREQKEREERERKAREEELAREAEERKRKEREEREAGEKRRREEEEQERKEREERESREEEEKRKEATASTTVPEVKKLTGLSEELYKSVLQKAFDTQFKGQWLTMLKQLDPTTRQPGHPAVRIDDNIIRTVLQEACKFFPELKNIPDGLIPCFTAESITNLIQSDTPDALTTALIDVLYTEEFEKFVGLKTAHTAFKQGDKPTTLEELEQQVNAAIAQHSIESAAE
ncbi:MAG: hypothetical protein H6679_04995 [Epsilonproteobacteria bacterium]|nr:hypothetical protein [Campylobacterota bacterium]